MRNTLVVISTFLLLIFTACGQEEVDETTANKLIDKAEETIMLLNDQAYDALTDTFADMLKVELTEDQLKEVEPFIKEAGEFKQVENPSIEKKDGIYTVVITGSYSEVDRTFTISFNEDEELVGLFVK